MSGSQEYGDSAVMVESPTAVFAVGVGAAQAAVESVRRMRQVDSINLIDQGIPGGPLIELGPRPDW